MTAQQKFRVDSFVSDKAIKAPCQAISVLNLTLSGEQTVNGTAVVAGDRVLVNAQTVPSENGIYDVEQTAWTRSADWDGDRDATNGTIVIVAGDPLVSLYQLDVTGTFTIGTSDATFILLMTLDLAAVLASNDNGEGASQVGIEDAGTLITATDVEGALAELVASINTNASDIATNVADIAANAVDIGFGEPESKVKLADETRTSDTTMTADDTLYDYAMVAGGVYKIDGFLSLYTYATPRFKCRFQVSETMQDSSILMIGMDDSAAQEYQGGLISILNPAIFSTVPVGLITAHITLRGQVKWHASNAGTMDFEWAQNVSDANITRLQEGSWITVTRIA